jgi:hypothetical protein
MKQRNGTVFSLGTFAVASKKLVISDPCYNREVWCMGTLDNVLNGTWASRVTVFDEGDWGMRVGYLIAFHESYVTDHNSILWLPEKFDVGVDSGQAGIYDEAEYHGGEDDFGDEGWYDINCNVTLGKNRLAISRQAGVINGGVVSNSGFGDGSYVCSTLKVKDLALVDQIVAVRIDFGLEAEEAEDEDNG